MEREFSVFLKEFISPKVAFFSDLDGTLVRLGDSRNSLEELRSRLLNLFSLHHVKPVTKSIFGMLQQCRLDSAPFLDQANELIDAYEKDWIESTEILSSARIISSLRGSLGSTVFRCGVITNNGLQCLSSVMNKFSELSSFTWNIARDSSTPLKPEPDFIEKALADLSDIELKSVTVVFIGDSDNDSECLKRFTEKHQQRGLFLSVSDTQDLKDTSWMKSIRLPHHPS